MAKCYGSIKGSIGISVALLVFFIINLRVEAGIATVFERALDGLIGGVVLMGLLYIGACFFGFITPPDNKGFLACCAQKKE